MRAFETYAQELESLAIRAFELPQEVINDQQLIAALDGGPSNALRRAVPIAKRRLAGAFFTGSKLANQALRVLQISNPDDLMFLDPACGAGDLLIAATRHLPSSTDLSETLSLWGQRLRGCDLHPQFVRAAKARLVLAAIERGSLTGHTPMLSWQKLFPGIKEGNGLKPMTDYSLASHILMNPPFSNVEAPDSCTWARGQISMAALFLDTCISAASSGTHIVAILPDVLRTGGRYEKWRQYIASRGAIRNVIIYGQFDRWADIDVFILHLTINPKRRISNPEKNRWWGQEKPCQNPLVADFFNVCVGPVVPYRDPKKGCWYPFIHPRLLPPWETVKLIREHRRYSGTVFTPPFVVIRRTSRPGDKYRAVGNIITGCRPVAVENHLIVLQPKDGTISSCRHLLNILRRAETNIWLNQRIRCRHLTVSAVKGLPWWDFNE